MAKSEVKNRPLAIDNRLALQAFVGNIIPSVIVVICLWQFDVSPYVLGMVLFFLTLLTIYSVNAVWQRTQFQFRNLQNLLDAIVGGDYALRGLGKGSGTAFGELIDTINALAGTLQKQRLETEESTQLLGKVVDQIDVAIVAWDEKDRIRLINPAARRLLEIRNTASASVASSELSTLPESLRFASNMTVGETQVSYLAFSNTRGNFRLHMERFIAEGNTHNLLFMTNVSNILRVEEKKAWRNLVRVLSHEINNSLTPLSSLSKSLKKQVQMRETDKILAAELIDGMSIIGSRADSLADFVQAYNQIAKLPDPQKAKVDLAQIVGRVVKLFPDHRIATQGENITLNVDSAQLEQALINLIKNAVEAEERSESEGSKNTERIAIVWAASDDRLDLSITDSGVGIQNSENLFTPFYTTKKEGSGIGLVISRQIIEAHGGYLTIANREQGSGCVVTIELPV